MLFGVKVIEGDIEGITDLEVEVEAAEVDLFTVAIFLTGAVELEDALACAPAFEAAFAETGADLAKDDDDAFDVTVVVTADCFLSVFVTDMVLGRFFKRLLYETDAAA